MSEQSQRKTVLIDENQRGVGNKSTAAYRNAQHRLHRLKRCLKAVNLQMSILDGMVDQRRFVSVLRGHYRTTLRLIAFEQTRITYIEATGSDSLLY